MIHSIIIIDNKNNGNYTKMINILRPKDAHKCFVCISKFYAAVTLPVGYIYTTHNLIININGTENTYTNDQNSNVIVRSRIVDAFMTSTGKASQYLNLVGDPEPNLVAFYSEKNMQDNWIDINDSDFNNFILSIPTTNVDSDFYNPKVSIQFVPSRDLQLSMHLKIKFE